ncbi:MAG TPA: hypothetical protein VHN74_04345 [Candidatus Angelobacter sp.]|jgi:hypothetical protein|nr:hypothetical protein [Candidatus Angelobacter sp.]
MFQGTMIDELIQSVERAEEKARERRQKEAELSLRVIPFRSAELRQSIEVA